MQAQCHFFQAGLTATVEQGAEQMGDALPQAAHPGALQHVRFTQLQQVLPGARTMLGVGQLQRGPAQAQPVATGAKLHGGAAQWLVLGGVAGCFEFDLQALGLYGRVGQGRKLGQPAGQQGVDHETVIGVVGAD
ncbi:hypothetical protein D3C79_690530 [compost metagenome]